MCIRDRDDYKQQTKDAVEGAGIFPLIGSDKYILMYDVYMTVSYTHLDVYKRQHHLWAVVRIDPVRTERAHQ